MTAGVSFLVAGLAAGALVPVGLGGGAPVAFPVPARTICAAGTAAIEVGVLYTNNPPGPRWFSVEIRNPRGQRVLHRRGLATRRGRFWRYDPPARRTALGLYRTTYRVSTGTEVFRTRVVRCRGR
jgi:hypothetical protein